MTRRRTALALAAVFFAAACDEGGLDVVRAPTDAGELHDWLLAGEYVSWESESAVFESQAGGGARVFVSPDLAESLATGGEVHPEGAAAVREIYAPDRRTLRGWAATVRLESDDSPEAWLWSEVLDPDPGADPQVAQRAAPGCIGCHGSGHDFVQTTMPLR